MRKREKEVLNTLLSFITEKQSSWEKLQAETRPIFIYGMGDGAEKIMRVFREKSIPLAGIFASDEFVRGHSFAGYKVRKLSEIEAQVDDFVIVLAFAAGYQSLVDKIVELNSFSAAAEALYLSQSALSQQIRTLEGQLQFELFQHVPRRVVLTPAGQDFYPKAKQLVALYQQALRHARAVQQQEKPPERHLVIAGCHEAMRMFAYDLFSANK